MPVATAVPSAPPEPAVSAARPLSGRRVTAAGVERDQLVERLAQLRAILPAFAEELATARRQAAVLRVTTGLVDTFSIPQLMRLIASGRRMRQPAHNIREKHGYPDSWGACRLRHEV